MSVQDRRDTDVELETLDVKALTTPMTVLADAPGVVGADNMWLVQHTTEHIVARVDEEFVCDCRGHQYGHTCYHIRRLAFELGERPIPAWVDRDAIDDGFRMFVGPDDHDPDAGAGGAAQGGVA